MRTPVISDMHMSKHLVYMVTLQQCRSRRDTNDHIMAESALLFILIETKI